MRKPTKKSIKNKLKKLWSDYIRTRDNFKCQWCGKQKDRYSCDAHHIIPKGRCGNAGRYDVDNGVTLCDYCHRYRKNSESVEYTRWIEGYLKNKGLSYDELNEKYQGAIIKENIAWLELQIRILTEMCEERK